MKRPAANAKPGVKRLSCVRDDDPHQGNAVSALHDSVFPDGCELARSRECQSPREFP